MDEKTARKYRRLDKLPSEVRREHDWRTHEDPFAEVWDEVRAMVEHEAHHRGQLYLMLGMLGITTPPLYGLTEKEVRAASLE